MCTWKLTPDGEGYYLTSCNYIANYHENETEFYEFCPYCGQDIEREY